ncbi:MAG: [FeFe] hydrogenase H-cluster maturation GTPase HydF [Peptococcaceae bacterium]|nr:MAG: [FeFe] hydrogenase H-cluster maturation GTPase HydF [Peptococcaceae bacterium]
MNSTPRGSRLHIAVCGRRNAGKSSLVNALTNQETAIVSAVPGTTADPVYKSMEILPVGPVVIIDTAGIDDTGELGELRVQKTAAVLNKADLVLLVADPARGVGGCERALLEKAKEKSVPVVGVVNKVDIYPAYDLVQTWSGESGLTVVPVSARTRLGIEDLKKEIIRSAPKDWAMPAIVGDLIEPGDTVVLVVPIDLAAPKGRLILPQVQTLRDILDHDARALVVKEDGLRKALADLAHKPRLVITDSQAFRRVAADTPEEIMLTSFSILYARYKGNLEILAEGAAAVGRLKPGDRVLVAEACTHHRVEGDIGTVKIPRWLCQQVGGPLRFEWVNGLQLPAELTGYSLLIHCGACMINRREMLHRIMQAGSAGVPVVNYGMLIASLHGILERALAPFPRALELFRVSLRGVSATKQSQRQHA